MIWWKDYPKPNLRFIQNVWVVEVNIPKSIRHLFGNGSWTTNNKRKATGTTDKAISEKLVTELAHKIYKEFDEAQLEYAKRNAIQANNMATVIIYRTAKAFNYNGGNIPYLSPDTNYDVLLAMTTALDGYNEMIENMRQELNEGQLDDIRKAIKKSSSLVGGSNDPEKLPESIDDIKTLLAPVNGTFTMQQNSLTSQHQTKIVQSYWQDLLTLTATEQGKKPPVFNGLEGIELAL
ncbi:hypothetical protein N8Z86_00080 [Amylibacter sp.]|nr:hypothetical protein [Amylibacter sp.]